MLVEKLQILTQTIYYTMKIYCYFLLFFLALWLFSACNKDEGLGGSSTIEGYVYEIRHLEDHSAFPVDIVPSVKQNVYINYGSDINNAFDDKAEDTNDYGYYRFSFLREGDYVVTAFSSYPNEKKAFSKNVKVSGRHNKADTIFIHTWYKAKGSAMIRGEVKKQYYKGTYKQYEGPAVDHRVTLKFFGQDVKLAEERTDNNGVFVFKELPAGKYEIYTTTERINDKNIVVATESQYIEIVDEPELNDLPEKFVVVENT